MLAKPTGPICNLDCQYCFFLSKEALYPGDRFRMTDDVLAAYIRQLIEAQAAPEVTIAWQGGEPTLMGVDFFRRAVALADEHRRPASSCTTRSRPTARCSPTSGASCSPSTEFLVGLSIDGPAAMHDAYRVDKRGAPTFDKVRRGLGPAPARTAST